MFPQQMAWYKEDFYPRPPRGGRHGKSYDCPWDVVFLSTPSARRATGLTVCQFIQTLVFLSTPSARRATAGK